jgi:hypothetical protein
MIETGTSQLGQSPALPIPAIVESSSAPDYVDAPLVVKKQPKGRKIVKKVAHIAPPTPETPKVQQKVGSLEDGDVRPLDLGVGAQPDTIPAESVAVDDSTDSPKIETTPSSAIPVTDTPVSSQARQEFFSTRTEVEMALNSEFEPKSHFNLLKRLSLATSSLISSHPNHPVSLEGAGPFLAALEATLSDGLRPSTNLWNLFCKTLPQEPLCQSPAPALTTATGRFRSALFTFLNQGRLKQQLDIVFSSDALLNEFYWPTSLFCNDQRVAMVLTLLQEFDEPSKLVSFDLPTESDTLDARVLYSDALVLVSPRVDEPVATDQKIAETEPVEPLKEVASQKIELENDHIEPEEDLLSAISLVDDVIQATLQQETDSSPAATATELHEPIQHISDEIRTLSDPVSSEIRTLSDPVSKVAPDSTNPFDSPDTQAENIPSVADRIEESLNPFDDEKTAPRAASSNPFDEPDRRPKSSNPFDSDLKRTENTPSISNSFRESSRAATSAQPIAPIGRSRSPSSGEPEKATNRVSTLSAGLSPAAKKAAPEWVRQDAAPKVPAPTPGQDIRPKNSPADRVATATLFSHSPPRDLRSGVPIAPGAPPPTQESTGAEARSVTFSSFEELFKAMRDSGEPGAPAEPPTKSKGKSRNVPSNVATPAAVVTPSGPSSQRYATTAFPSRGGASGQFMSASVPISSARSMDDPFTGSPPENLLNAKIVWNYTPVSPYRKINRSNRFLLSSSSIGPATPERNPDRLRTFAGFSSTSTASSSDSTPEILSVKEPEVVVEAQQAVIQGQDPRATFVLDVVLKKKKFGAKTANCAECGQDLQKKGMLGKEPPYCFYTANYYCNDCHKGRLSAIPARIISAWDFKEYPVCNWAKRYIDENFKNPILDFDKISVDVQKKILALTRVRAMREKLVLMGEYIQSCRNSSRLLNEVEGRTHLVWSTKQCSLEDLDWLRDGRLEKYISHVVDVYTVHIITCEICKGKGFFCEICDSKQLLFLFQEGVIQCPKCKNVFHSNCFERVVACPKCERVKRIRSRSNPASEQAAIITSHEGSTNKNA